MIRVRNGVWETNSSSCHSITIHKGDYVLNTKDFDSYITNGKLSIELGEFGWGYDESNDGYVKASYLLTMCKMLDSTCDEQNIIDLLGAILHIHDITLTNEDDCYIDHESVMSLHCLLEEVPGEFLLDKVERFIFDPNITLIIDGDG